MQKCPQKAPLDVLPGSTDLVDQLRQIRHAIEFDLRVLQDSADGGERLLLFGAELSDHDALHRAKLLIPMVVEGLPFDGVLARRADALLPIGGLKTHRIDEVESTVLKAERNVDFLPQMAEGESVGGRRRQAHWHPPATQSSYHRRRHQPEQYDGFDRQPGQDALLAELDTFFAANPMLRGYFTVVSPGRYRQTALPASTSAP